MIPMTSTIWAYNEFLTDGLFKEATFPSGIDKELVIDTIMLKYGESEPLYKDADFMQWACTSWSKKWFHSFDRWNYALTEEYNPLHNYDRFEDITEENSEDISANNLTTGNSSSTSTNTRSSFDSSTYQPHDKNDFTNNSSANSNSSSNSNGNLVRNAHLYGNIGVTTSGTMLMEEIQVRKNNIYDLIADCFVTELCLLVY